MAAEYIAAQFRRAGLEPVGDEGYFQNAKYQSVKPNPDGLEFTLGDMRAEAGTVAIQEAVAADLNRAAAFKIKLSDTVALNALTVDQVRGKVLLVEVPDGGGGRGNSGFQAQRRILTQLAKLEPAMVVMVRASAQPASPNARVPLRDATAPAPKAPVLNVWDKAIHAAVAAAAPGPMEAVVSTHIAAPIVQPVKLRNVAGILRGTDPQLKDTYIIVTGHYDHLGMRPNASGDSIYNGANDDASGTASVIAVAGALASLEEKPRRTIVFVTVFGEEVGGLGARWYTGHPIFPLAKTVADINLEQLGRTDDMRGSRGRAVQSDRLRLHRHRRHLCQGGRNHRREGDQTRDQQRRVLQPQRQRHFADAGIPSTTLSVSYVFPDYHRARRRMAEVGLR